MSNKHATPDKIDIWKHNGAAFRYPQCCIESFCYDNIDNRTYDQILVGELGYGFIPCPTHADQIVAGKLSCRDLINNRRCDIPAFPNDGR